MSLSQPMGPPLLENKPCIFYKLIMASTLQENKLKLPNKFVKKYRDELLSTVKISVPGGHKWFVALGEYNKTTWLDLGWNTFVENYSIGIGHFLVFKYQGNSHFDVHIYDLKDSEINYQEFDRKPLLEDVEDDGFAAVTGSLQHENAAATTCLHQDSSLLESQATFQSILDEGVRFGGVPISGPCFVHTKDAKQDDDFASIQQHKNATTCLNQESSLLESQATFQSTLDKGVRFSGVPITSGPCFVHTKDGEFAAIAGSQQHKKATTGLQQESSLLESQAMFQSSLDKDIQFGGVPITSGPCFVHTKDGEFATIAGSQQHEKATTCLHQEISLLESQAAFQSTLDKGIQFGGVPITSGPCFVHTKDGEFAAIAGSQQHKKATTGLHQEISLLESQATFQSALDKGIQFSGIPITGGSRFVHTKDVKQDDDFAVITSSLQHKNSTTCLYQENSLPALQATFQSTLNRGIQINGVAITSKPNTTGKSTSVPRYVTTKERQDAFNAPLMFKPGNHYFVPVELSEPKNPGWKRHKFDHFGQSSSAGHGDQYDAETRRRRYESASTGNRTVTAEEKGKAIKAALTFESANPFFRVVLQPSYRGCIMYLPSDFAEKYLTGASDYIKLQLPDGRQWLVRYLYRDGIAKFLGGWYEFALANNLREGDICIFELIGTTEMIVLKVTVFRVTENAGLMHSSYSGQIFRN